MRVGAGVRFILARQGGDPERDEEGDEVDDDKGERCLVHAAALEGGPAAVGVAALRAAHVHVVHGGDEGAEKKQIDQGDNTAVP